MSADNIFKYAHSLKGTGKYARSKRLMRLYNRKVKDDAASNLVTAGTSTPNEVVLDNILGTEQKFEIKNMGINTSRAGDISYETTGGFNSTSIACT